MEYLTGMNLLLAIKLAIYAALDWRRIADVFGFSIWKVKEAKL